MRRIALRPSLVRILLLMADDPRYHGKSWPEVEEDMRQAYFRERANNTWDSGKDAIRYGWQRVSGRR